MATSQVGTEAEPTTAEVHHRHRHKFRYYHLSNIAQRQAFFHIFRIDFEIVRLIPVIYLKDHETVRLFTYYSPSLLQGCAPLRPEAQMICIALHDIPA
jgi:hypothetical protein